MEGWVHAFRDDLPCDRPLRRRRPGRPGRLRRAPPPLPPKNIKQMHAQGRQAQPVHLTYAVEQVRGGTGMVRSASSAGAAPGPVGVVEVSAGWGAVTFQGEAMGQDTAASVPHGIPLPGFGRCPFG